MNTVYKFPETNDSCLKNLLDILRLEPVSTTRFRARNLNQFAGRIYGGQLIAQGLVAALQCLPSDRTWQLHTAQTTFIRGGDADKTYDLDVVVLQQGRSFNRLLVTGIQGGIDLFTLVASFQVEQPGLVHQEQITPATAPEELTSMLEQFQEMEHPFAQHMAKVTAFDVHYETRNIFSHPDPEKPYSQRLWLRPRELFASPVEANISKVLINFAIDQLMLEPAIRGHGLCWQTPGLAIASLDHTIWTHRDFDINQWLYIVQSSPFSGNSRAFGQMKIYTAEGLLVATANQEAMLRLPREGSAGDSRWELAAPAAATEN